MRKTPTTGITEITEPLKVERIQEPLQPLKVERIQERLAALPGWSLTGDDGPLTRTYAFPTPSAAGCFVQLALTVAEERVQERPRTRIPEIDVRGRKVEIRIGGERGIGGHRGGLREHDFDLAASLDGR